MITMEITEETTIIFNSILVLYNNINTHNTSIRSSDQIEIQSYKCMNNHRWIIAFL